MACRAARPWTLIGLLAAFLDLALAYFLLYVSAFGFFYSRFLDVFGLWLPCPCRGILGYVNSNLCIQKLFVELPIRKIYSVQVLIKTKYPFSSICFEEQECSFNVKFSGGRNSGNGFLELNGELSSIRGKAALVQKQKSTRRRRRVSLGNGKLSPVSPLKNLGSPVADVRPSCQGYNGVRSEISEILGPSSGIEDRIQDGEKIPVDTELDEKEWHGFELSESSGGSKSGVMDLDFVENIISNAQNNQELVDTEANKIRMLEQALEEIKAAHTILCLELEKERAAAATAADEAIAMILRLQKEKAAVEMEVRQNQRMVDEKFAYDEEEMNILKEILIRKEREILFLENEVEAYKQMISGDKNLDGQFQDVSDRQPEIPSSSVHPDDDPWSIMPQRVGGGLIVKKGEVLSNNDFSRGENFQNEILDLAGKGNSKMCETNGDKRQLSDGSFHQERKLEPSYPCTTAEKFISCDGNSGIKYGEQGDKEGPDVQSLVHDTQQVIYDVHVVDDKTDQQVKRNEKESYPQISSFDEQIDFDQNIHGSNLDVDNGLGELGILPKRSSVPESLSDISSERSRLDSEVGWLREMLRTLQEEKDKLKLSSENKDRGKTQIKLLEEIRDQLQELQKLRELPRHASIPPSFSKTNLKARRSQSGV